MNLDIETRHDQPSSCSSKNDTIIISTMFFQLGSVQYAFMLRILCDYDYVYIRIYIYIICIFIECQ